MLLGRAQRMAGAALLTGVALYAGAPVAAADDLREEQWANTYFKLDQVWQVTKGEGVVVAVIDSGVDAGHPDLTGQVLPGYDPSGKGLNTSPADPHGTSMASLIAGHGHGAGGADGVVGIAPGVKILPIYKDDARGYDAVPEDIRWAVDHGAKVINISLGGKDGASRSLSLAVAYAVKHDVLIVAAAGNEGEARVLSPADSPGVLAVSAVDRGLDIWAESSFGPQIMLAAPGVGIVAAGACDEQKYCLGEGTSDATAYVSGAAALVRAKYPDLTAGQVADRLVKSALVTPSLQGAHLPDQRFGYGILRPLEALTQQIPAGPADGPLARPVAATAPAGSRTTASGSGTTGSPAAGSPPAGLLLLAVPALIALLLSRRLRRRNAAAAAALPYPPPPFPYQAPPGAAPYETPSQDPHPTG
ncbi:S8 family serine peptidase [Kitasatospora sp. NPDC048540]|uniref:S8 family serine peptidase n=1 Tax=unclassified Kitasatospora TaxID=2633591 RepID=UPI0009E6C15A|nr:S8 family serine peptidase [Kitasatospora sp. MBT63]